MNHHKLLVVDDDQGVVDFLTEMLNEQGYMSTGTTSANEALRLIKDHRFDMVISDIEMPEMRGTELLKVIHATTPDTLVLLITAFGSIDLAVQSVRDGACDFVTKPFQIEVLYHAITRAFREREMRREIVRLREAVPLTQPGSLVAHSPSMQRLVELARRAATIDATILLTGESGAGKGALAQFIHQHSPRKQKPFVHLNCAAIPANLVESELFGIRRGAFTDAREHRDGMFQQAHGGTIFLDEIAEMPLESQPKLLQALETNRVRPVGGSAEIPFDARVIAATNRPLEDALREKQFRPDLYYRLNVIRLDIPPLRERREDIPPLVDVFLQNAAKRFDREIIGVTREAMRWIVGHSWPGNVRELANMIERAVALTEHDTIVLNDLTMVSDVPASQDYLAHAASQCLPLEEVERTYIQKVLELSDGNKAQAARILGIDRRTLYRKVESQH